MAKRRKTVEMPKHPDPWMVVMDAIIEYGLKYDEFMKKLEMIEKKKGKAG